MLKFLIHLLKNMNVIAIVTMMTATADTNINIELNKKGLLSPFFIEVTYERTLYSHTVLQTKMQVL